MFPKGIINFTAAYKLNDKNMYISSNDINALYRIDLLAEKVSYVGAFIDRKDISVFYHVHVAYYNYMLFFVDRFSLSVDCYDIKKNIFLKYSFPKELVSKYHSWKIVSDDMKVYFISNLICGGMIEFDMQRKSFVKSDIWMNQNSRSKYNLINSENLLCFERSKSFTDGIIRIHIRNTNIIAEYDTVKKKMYFRDLPKEIKGNISQVQFRNKQFIILLENDKIVICTEQMHIINELKIPISDDYCQFVCGDKDIYYFCGSKIYYHDRSFVNTKFTQIRSEHHIDNIHDTYTHYTEKGIWLNSIIGDKHLLLNRDKITSVSNLKYPDDENLNWFWRNYNDYKRILDETEIRLNDYIDAIKQF